MQATASLWKLPNGQFTQFGNADVATTSGIPPLDISISVASDIPAPTLKLLHRELLKVFRCFLPQGFVSVQMWLCSRLLHAER